MGGIQRRVLVVVAAAIATGCSSTTATRRQASLSSNEVVFLVQKMVTAATGALSSLQPTNRASAASRGLRSPVSFQVSTAYDCEQGGQIVLEGSVAGNIDDATGSGALATTATQTLAFCHTAVGGTEMILDGVLQLTGNYVLVGGTPANDQSATLSGEMAISAAPRGSGTCSVDLSFSFKIDTQIATVTGTACGLAIGL